MGYDCSTWRNVKRLIDAVRGPQRLPIPTKTIYPDRWSGPAAYTSSIYPDRWTAEEERARRGVTLAYKATGPPGSVPPFVIQHGDILKNVKNYSSKRGSKSKAGQNPKLIPIVNKRTSENDPGVTSTSGGPHKKPKLEQSNQVNNNITDFEDKMIIDLTGDENLDPVGRIRRSGTSITLDNRPPKAPRSMLGNITKGTARDTRSSLRNHPSSPAAAAASGKRRRIANNNKNQTAALKALDTALTTINTHLRADQQQEHDQQAQQDKTTGILARVASRLYATSGDVEKDRNTLRERWEVDDSLKDISVTKDLSELNACFARIEEAIVEGTNMIEERLLKRM